MDSSAAWHMTSQREWLYEYEYVSRGFMSFTNYHSLEVIGIINIKLKIHDGMNCTIQEVRYVKSLIIFCA